MVWWVEVRDKSRYSLTTIPQSWWNNNFSFLHHISLSMKDVTINLIFNCLAKDHLDIHDTLLLGGWHHIEVHEDQWWILRMTTWGSCIQIFRHSKWERLLHRIKIQWSLILGMKAINKKYMTGQCVGSFLVRYLSAFGFAFYCYHLSHHGALLLQTLWIMITSLHL